MAIRKYKCHDVEMLTASETILNHCIENSSVLIAKRPLWHDPFFPNLLQTLEEAYSKYLGIDNAKELREASAEVNRLQSSSLNLLSDFKTQLSVDFGSDKPRLNEILNQLGFNGYYRKASNGSQQALMELLAKFKNNMSAELETEITGKGTGAALITGIKDYFETFRAANTRQETAKGKKINITAAEISGLNEVYTTIVGICKIARKAFNADPVKKDLFSFAKTVAAQGRPKTQVPVVNSAEVQSS